MSTTIAGIIREHAAARATTAAVVQGERTVTYGELDERSNRAAAALAADGVAAGERVAILDKNVPEFFDLLFGAAKLGAVVCPVNWRLAPSEAAFIINDAEAKVLVVGDELLPVLDAMEGALTAVKHIVVVGEAGGRDEYEAWLARHEPVDPGVQPAADDVAIQFYSSGTTGRPKGVMLTNANLFSGIDAALELLGFDERSVNLVVMPLFHVAGGLWALIGLYLGIPNILTREVNPPEIIELIPRYGVTHAVFVPAVLQFLLATPGVHDADFSSLVALLYGASPISEEVLTGSIRTFGCKFVQAYGMTETTGGVVFLPADDHDVDGPNAHRLRAAGKPVAGSAVRVVDPATFEDLPLGEVGEIVVQSAQNMKGYWKMPEATAETILDGGWLRTGDAGYLDEDGYVYIHDRVKDMIISGGENIYPAEVENVLMAHDDVGDAAAIGVPDDRWGEAVKAVVVAKPGHRVDVDGVIAFCRERLAHFKCPTSVDVVAELPRNPSGKILKKELRAPYWEGRARGVN